LCIEVAGVSGCNRNKYLESPSCRCPLLGVQSLRQLVGGGRGCRTWCDVIAAIDHTTDTIIQLIHRVDLLSKYPIPSMDAVTSSRGNDCESEEIITIASPVLIVPPMRKSSAAKLGRLSAMIPAINETRGPETTNANTTTVSCHDIPPKGIALMFNCERKSAAQRMATSPAITPYIKAILTMFFWNRDW
jgi:hypothetical protein